MVSAPAKDFEKQTRTAIADVLLLQQQLRQFNSFDELAYFLSNETAKIVEYRTAIFWFEGATGSRVESVSGIPFPARDAPFTLWVGQVCGELIKQALEKPVVVDATLLPKSLANSWADFLPAHVTWVPLKSPSGKRMGGLLLARDSQWSSEEKGLLEYWAGASAHAIEALLNRRESVLEKIKPHMKKIVGASIAVLLVLLVLPVSQTVLAPAEVVPMNPFIVRAPVDEVIRKIHVAPNQVVVKGDLLVTIDDSALSARLDVAMQELQIAQAEYRRAEQASVGDREAAAQLPMLRASVERRDAEVAHVKTLLGRTQINSEIDGIAILRDIQELEGKPVRIGEKILTIAKPDSAELEFWLMVGDSVPLPERAEVVLFSNVKPEKPVKARLEYVNYQAELSPEGTLAFRGRAQFTKRSDLPRIGWRGTAKVYGKDISLGYYLFRRPYAAARQWLGI